MYRQIMTPTEQNHIVTLPKELYGFRVEVLAFSLEEQEQHFPSNENADAFYDTINLDFSGFKFNRDEANER